MEVSPLTEVYVSDRGVKGKVIRIPGSYQLKTTVPPDNDIRPIHVVLVPGNPGLAAFYRPFVMRLWKRLGGVVSVHALSLPGMDFAGMNGTKERFGICEHENYFRSYIRTDILSEQKDPSITSDVRTNRPSSTPWRRPHIILTGHSYGAFLSLSIINRLPKDTDISLVLLMPCLWEMGQCGGFALRVLLATFPLLAWVIALFLSLVPSLLKESVVRSGAIGTCDELAVALLQFASGLSVWSLYENMAHLAEQEVAQIRNPRADGLGVAIDRVKASTLAVYVDKDGWCPHEGEQCIGQAFGKDGLDVKRVGDGIRHAFVLDRKGNEVVSAVVGEWIEKRFKLC